MSHVSRPLRPNPASHIRLRAFSSFAVRCFDQSLEQRPSRDRRKIYRHCAGTSFSIEPTSAMNYRPGAMQQWQKASLEPSLELVRGAYVHKRCNEAELPLESLPQAHLRLPRVSLRISMPRLLVQPRRESSILSLIIPASCP